MGGKLASTSFSDPFAWSGNGFLRLLRLCCIYFIINIFIVYQVASVNFRYIYRPQTKLQKGNVFTPVCEFCSHGEVYTPPEQTPPGQTPPPADTPPGQTHTPHTHPGRHPPADRHNPPTPRWPLQHTVRILLECILVINSSIVTNSLYHQ